MYPKYIFKSELKKFRQQVLSQYSRNKLVELFHYKSWRRLSVDLPLLDLIQTLDIELNSFSPFFSSILTDPNNNLVWLSESDYFRHLADPRKKHSKTTCTLDNFM